MDVKKRKDTPVLRKVSKPSTPVKVSNPNEDLDRQKVIDPKIHRANADLLADGPRIYKIGEF